MKILTLLVFVAVPTLAASPVFAQSDGCIGCKEAAPMTDRERIKAGRAKFDLEMKRDTARPWDGLDLGVRKEPTAAKPIPVPDRRGP
jgi:hypothetical protein